LVESYISKKMDWESGADCMASSVSESISMTSCRDTEEDVNAVLTRSVQHFVAIFKATVTTAHVSVSRRV
jgi:hypothetical protein